MAKIVMQLVNREGNIIKSFESVGDLKQLGDVMNNAILETINPLPELHLSGDSDFKVNVEHVKTNEIEKVSEIIEKQEEKIIQSAGVKKELLKDDTEIRAGRVMTQNPNKRALTFFRCEHCDKINIGVHTPHDEIECFYCKETTTVPEGLIHAEYQCSNCSLSAFAYMELGVMEEVKCKGCKSPIDLHFNEKKGNYVSLNKLR